MSAYARGRDDASYWKWVIVYRGLIEVESEEKRKKKRKRKRKKKKTRKRVVSYVRRDMT